MLWLPFIDFESYFKTVYQTENQLEISGATNTWNNFTWGFEKAWNFAWECRSQISNERCRGSFLCSNNLSLSLSRATKKSITTKSVVSIHSCMSPREGEKRRKALRGKAKGRRRKIKRWGIQNNNNNNKKNPSHTPFLKKLRDNAGMHVKGR